LRRLCAIQFEQQLKLWCVNFCALAPGEQSIRSVTRRDLRHTNCSCSTGSSLYKGSHVQEDRSFDAILADDDAYTAGEAHGAH
jgi:hypothetical protein